LGLISAISTEPFFGIDHRAVEQSKAGGFAHVDDIAWNEDFVQVGTVALDDFSIGALLSRETILRVISLSKEPAERASAAKMVAFTAAFRWKFCFIKI
jgi:hypothetical protein